MVRFQSPDELPYPTVAATGAKYFYAEITTRIRSGNRAVEVTLDCEKYPAEIRYTLDGTPPTPDASLYEAPFTVTDSTVVRAAVCRDGVIRSPERKQLVTLAAEIDNYYPFDVPEIWKEYFD